MELKNHALQKRNLEETRGLSYFRLEQGMVQDFSAPLLLVVWHCLSRDFPFTTESTEIFINFEKTKLIVHHGHPDILLWSYSRRKPFNSVPIASTLHGIAPLLSGLHHHSKTINYYFGFRNFANFETEIGDVVGNGVQQGMIQPKNKPKTELDACWTCLVPQRKTRFIFSKSRSVCKDYIHFMFYGIPKDLMYDLSFQ